MKYFTAVDAVEGLESALDTDGIMLTGEDCLLRMENQRLLMQSLMIDPPETEHDPRLVQMMRSQTMLWSEKIEECVKKQLCIRLPDRPIDAFLPATPAEISRRIPFSSNSTLRVPSSLWSPRPRYLTARVLPSSMLIWLVSPSAMMPEQKHTATSI